MIYVKTSPGVICMA